MRDLDVTLWSKGQSIFGDKLSRPASQGQAGEECFIYHFGGMLYSNDFAVLICTVKRIYVNTYYHG